MGSLLACTAYLLDVHVLQSEWPSRAHPRLCPQPQTPHLEEDLKEVLRSEAGIELIIEDDMRPEKQKRKPGVSGRGLDPQLCPGSSHRKPDLRAGRPISALRDCSFREGPGFSPGSSRTVNDAAFLPAS